MSSTHPKSGGGSPAPAPTFSYAQAAKGRSASVPSTAPPVPATDQAAKGSAVTNTPEPSTSPAPEPTHQDEQTNSAATSSTASKEQAAPSVDEPAAPAVAAATAATTTAAVVAPVAAPMSSSDGEAHSPEKSISPQRPLRLSSSASRSSSPTRRGPSTTPRSKDDGATSTPNVTSDPGWDKQSQWSASADEPSEHGSNDRARNGVREDSKERPSSLVAAPVPAVNFWQKRQEELAAVKAKSTTGTPGSRAPLTEAKPNPTGRSTEAKSNPSGRSTEAAGDRAPESSKPNVGKNGPDDGIERDEVAAKAAATAEPTPPQDANAAKDRGRSGGGERSRDDNHVFKKPPPRHRNFSDKEKQKDADAPMGPPSVMDSSAWPTPDTAKDQAQKKPQEKSDKADKAEKAEVERAPATNAKPHKKEKWTHIPYTPSVIFETPLSPPRLGRPARGGRGGARGGAPASNGSLRGDRGPPGAGAASGGAEAAGPANRGGEDAASTKAAPPPDEAPKRAVSAGPQAGREQRKPVPSAVPERRRESDVPGLRNPERRTSNQMRRTSNAAQPESAPRGRIDSRQHGRGGESGFQQAAIGGAPDRSHSTAHEGQPHPRGPYERRMDPPPRGMEHGREHGREPARETGHHGPHRERGEPRPDRGRGGSFRGGRGGGSSNNNNSNNNNHHGNNNGFAGGPHPGPNAFANGNPPVPPGASSYGPNKGPSFGPHHHPQHSRQASASQANAGLSRSRSFRHHSRSPTRPNHAAFSRYASVPNNSQPISQIQTQVGPTYEYQALQAMSAVPYSPFVEQYSVLSMVSMQMEYYFSVDNLCKDLFLRKHMDSYGFVFLNVLANFNRIRQLTQDIELLRYACFQSRTIELYQGLDGLDRVRRREGWQQWVLVPEERDGSVRNEAPAQASPLPAEQTPAAEMRHESNRHSMASVDRPAPHVEGAGAESSYAGTNGATQPVIQASSAPTSNGTTATVATTSPSTTTNGDGGTHQAPLGAPVLGLSPVVPFPAFQEEGQPKEPTPADAFSDSQVENLMMVIRDPANPPAEGLRHPAVIRTFSNGSIDEKTIAEAFGEGASRREPRRSGAEGSPASSGSQRIKSLSPPHRSGSRSTDATATSSSPVFWMKDRETPMESFPDGLLHESYSAFRENALKQRASTTTTATATTGSSSSSICAVDMNLLYEFWSHFLVRNFNTRMYDEFRQLALEDRAQRQSDVGFKHLVRYYDAALNGQQIISDRIARDYVGFVEAEPEGQESLAFTKLRSSWRNGALNLKNRKKIDSLLGAELKTRLDR